MPIPKSKLMRRLRGRRRAERLVETPARACVVCDKPLPIAVRADAKCCSAVCRARLSRAPALPPAKVAELRAALGSLLSEMPSNGRKSLTRGDLRLRVTKSGSLLVEVPSNGRKSPRGDGLRFAVTKQGGDFVVEGKGGRPRLHACYRPDGTARRYQKAARFERAMHEALCPSAREVLEEPGPPADVHLRA
jgi:hypothetical protein